MFAMLFAGFSALGVWQVQRLAWKQALIRQVDARIHAAPVAAPPPDQTITRQTDQYRRVVVSGRFDHQHEALVKAVTDLGPGYWVMTPLVTDRGFTVLINRGFVPSERQKPAERAAAQVEGETTVVGLLRLTEPDGGFLRANDPAGDRWFSRDVAGIAKARGLAGPVASYFIDADATPNPGGWPRGGLTVVRFANSHLIYALTWFGLALMSAAGFVLFLREERKRRR
ncbi:surfeit locus 1 family protein [Brevundimonas bullata]|uniref:SURF1-like protein n=1 Tax=Brevundimonas bullata TaxID=13160 RepID=A0A7W7IQS5_9CAUL|nr:SURF1 family protein [Brevundimonas bullata]MBB4798818.1 surfeit locus 1 family protein [Brevundimonas bullata]MBB6383778.1 surfeit locus 1 family protein [Brevundimonas bullata]